MAKLAKSLVLLCCGCTHVHYHVEAPPPVWESAIEAKTRTSFKNPNIIDGIDATVSLKRKR